MASHFKFASDPSFTADVTEFYQDPHVFGEYNPYYQWGRRGSIAPCLSGVQIQDMGFDMQDRKIIIRDPSKALKQTHVDALWAKCQQKNAEWYFTDGVHVFKVRFWYFDAPPFQSLYGKGLQESQPPPDRYVWYSYEMILLVREVIS
ncbi:MAG: hypothetical protein JXA50_01810 [Deltaproteobacteria bacterium]|nr:hypothetical protein [Deltaproteobacteria bacterium]